MLRFDLGKDSMALTVPNALEGGTSRFVLLFYTCAEYLISYYYACSFHASFSVITLTAPLAEEGSTLH